MTMVDLWGYVVDGYGRRTGERSWIGHRPVPTAESKMQAELVLIRTVLGLSPVHDVVAAVRVLHDEGRAAFEELRGPRRDDAMMWKPRD